MKHTMPVVADPNGRREMHSWESLGGVLVYGPEVVAADAARIDVFAVGGDHAVYHRDGQHGWRLIGDDPALPSATGFPVRALALGPRQVEVFSLGVDQMLWQLTWDGSTSTRWQQRAATADGVGHPITTVPGLVSAAPGSIDVFAVGGADRSLLHGVLDATGFVWKAPPITTRRLISAPCAVSRAPGDLDVFCVDADSFVVYASSQNGGPWSDWTSIRGPVFSPVSAVSCSPGRLDAFAIAADNTVKQMSSTDGGTTWVSTSLGWEAYGELTAVATAADRIDLFVVGKDNSVYRNTQIAEHWSGWVNLEVAQFPLGPWFFSAPAVTATSDWIDVFAIGKDSAVWHYRTPAAE